MLDFYIVCLTFVRIIFPKIMPDWISAITAFVTLLLTSYTIWRDFFKNISRSTSKKLKINRLDCLVETGNTTDQTHAFTAITLEIENKSDYIVEFTSVSLKVNYNHKIRYITLVGKREIIQPLETKVVHTFTYLCHQYEIPNIPIPPLQIQHSASKQEQDNLIATYIKNSQKFEKRFHKENDVKDKLKAIVEKTYNTTDGNAIKDIVSCAELHIVFKTDKGFNTSKTIKLSEYDEFKKITTLF